MCPNDNISKEEMIIRANRDAVCALIVRVNQATSEEIPQSRRGCCMCPNDNISKEEMIIRVNRGAICAQIVRVIQANK